MKTQVAKEVTVLARGQHKLNPKAVCYLILSSDGVTKYQTVIYDGKCSSCGCKGFQGYRHCKHGDHCVKLEVARNYDVIGEAVKLFDKAIEDARYGDFYEQRAEQMRARETAKMAHDRKVAEDLAEDGDPFFQPRLSREAYCSEFGIYE